LRLVTDALEHPAQPVQVTAYIRFGFFLGFIGPQRERQFASIQWLIGAEREHAQERQRLRWEFHFLERTARVERRFTQQPDLEAATA